MKKIVLMLFGLLYLPLASASIVRVDFANMNQDPYTIEDFEGTLNSGASYSAFSGTTITTETSSVKSPDNALTTNVVAEQINISFTNPVTSAGYWFGNDNPADDSSFVAVMDIFTANGFFDAIGIDADMDNSNNQFLGFVGDELVTEISIQYLVFNDDFTDERLAQLFHAIDDVMWNEASNIPPVPVPAAFWLFGTALIGFIGISRRRKVA